MSWAAREITEPTTILLVNDDSNIRKILLGKIKSYRPEWNVLTANSGGKAVDIFKARPEITHIVTDKNMTGGNARWLLRCVAEHLKAHPEEQRAFKGAVVYSSYEDEDFDRIEAMPTHGRSGLATKIVIDPIDEWEIKRLDRFQIEGMRIRMLRKEDLRGVEPSTHAWEAAAARHVERLSELAEQRGANK